MIIGMANCNLLYIAIGFTALAVVNWTSLQFDPAPLATAGSVALSYTPELALIGGTILGLGALISISGFEESATLATARLSYAISLDGLFPKLFSRIHPRFWYPCQCDYYTVRHCVIPFINCGLTQLIHFFSV